MKLKTKSNIYKLNQESMHPKMTKLVTLPPLVDRQTDRQTDKQMAFHLYIADNVHMPRYVDH